MKTIYFTIIFFLMALQSAWSDESDFPYSPLKEAGPDWRKGIDQSLLKSKEHSGKCGCKNECHKCHQESSCGCREEKKCPPPPPCRTGPRGPIGPQGPRGTDWTEGPHRSGQQHRRADRPVWHRDNRSCRADRTHRAHRSQAARQVPQALAIAQGQLDLANFRLTVIFSSIAQVRPGQPAPSLPENFCRSPPQRSRHQISSITILHPLLLRLISQAPTCSNMERRRKLSSLILMFPPQLIIFR